MSTYLGQNFLTDIRYQKDIVGLLARFSFDDICEIGPGKGAITRHILQLPQPMIAIEKDETLYPRLQGMGVPLIQQDALLVKDKDISDTPSRTVIIGNLPYYITSPLLRHFFEGPARWAGGVCLIQKEVADKIRHDAGKKSFLRWLLNYSHRVDYALTVPARAFTPAPKVTSAVVTLTPKETYPDISPQSLVALLDVLSLAKRKTLGKIMKMQQKKGIGLQIPDNLMGLRLEDLGWDEMLAIHNISSISP